MNDVSRIPSDVEHGDAQAAGELLPLVHAALRRLAKLRPAREKPGQTLQATASVHEADLRLVDGETIQRRESRGHLHAAAAEAMRHIRIDRARDKGRLKRGGGRRRHHLDLDELFNDEVPHDDLLDLDDAPTRLADVDHGAAAPVELRIFAGLTLGQAAEALGRARRTADRDWAFARAWLFEQLGTANEQRRPSSPEGHGPPRTE